MLVNNQVCHYSTSILQKEGLKKAIIILFINEFLKLNIKYGCDPVSVPHIFLFNALRIGLFLIISAISPLFPPLSPH